MLVVIKQSVQCMLMGERQLPSLPPASMPRFPSIADICSRRHPTREALIRAVMLHFPTLLFLTEKSTVAALQ